MFSDEFVKLWDDLKANLILKMDLCHSKQIYKAYCFLAFLTNYGKKVARCRTFLTRKQTFWLINPTATKISRTKKTGNRFAMAKCVRNMHGLMKFWVKIQVVYLHLYSKSDSLLPETFVLFASLKALHKWWKMFFILSLKVFLLSRYLSFCHGLLVM